MRFLFPGLFVFCFFQLTAQKGNDPYYIQQAPVQQMPQDCYQRNLEEGQAAQKRGDCRLALRWYQDALSCPEILKLPGRQDELKALIAQCSETQKVALEKNAGANRSVVVSRPKASNREATAAVNPESRRHFRPSREFLLYDKPACFDITCKEAARAFREKCWDDAAALYRAAKNCEDADQADRMAANAHIKACREASQNELLQKEQDAVRQARHALAANRAEDARQLLRNYDRSLAYRLADFANEYIAPEDNDACRQVMFEALYYNPAAQAGSAAAQVQIPFCYQLGDNLDQDLQVCFLGRKHSTKIVAFARSRHLLFRWDANSFEPELPIQLEDTTLLYVDAVPDGRTLLLLSNDAYLFWRSAREVFRLPAKYISRYCFSPDGRSFFFLDPDEGQVFALDLSDAFATRKGSSQRATPRPTGIYINSGILHFAYDNKQFWLGYPDSIVMYSPSTADSRLWTHQKTVQLGYRTPNYFRGQPPFLWLNPSAQTAVFSNDTSAVVFQIPENPDAPVPPTQFLSGAGLAVGANADLLTTYQTGFIDQDNSLLFYHPTSGQLRYKALVPANNTGDNLTSGIFSADNRLFATTNSSGKLEVWLLAEEASRDGYTFDNSRFVAPTTDGSKLFIWRNDSLLLVQANQPDKILQAGPAPVHVNIPGLLAAQNWLAYRSSADSVVLTNELRRKRLSILAPRRGLEEITGAFRPDEQQFAAMTAVDSVVVFDLSTGKALAGRKFGGPILKIYFVPQSDEVLVVHLVESENQDQEQTVIKLWDPTPGSTAAMRTVRLQGYENREVAFSKKQAYIAFTNGLDIRVFDQSDLLDETIRIRQNDNHVVMALEFHPDGDMLAAGYEDGSVVFWDVNTGQARFTWSAPAGMDPFLPSAVAKMRFLEQGRRLQILFQNNQLLTRDLEVSNIRAGVQTDFRKLIAFQPSEIREYDLEQAFEYPNNFARLAASGDLPLIRSFFDFFRETAQFSNNVQRVGNACDRAAALFAQLDGSTQGVLRPILLDMFQDYHWKLLLRNQTELAQKVAASMQADFGKPVAATLAFAHTALLQGDERRAATQYAEWAFRSAESGIISRHSLDGLHAKLVQLLEYNLLEPERLNCICSLFGRFPPFDQRCASITPVPVAALLDEETTLRWRIFEQLNATQFTKNNQQKVQLLEAALADARRLQSRNSGAFQATFENVLLALSSVYSNWGIFEQAQPVALGYFQKALNYLNTSGAFSSTERETLRQANAATNYLYIGNYYQSHDQLLLAVSSYRQGLLEADRLLRNLDGNPLLAQKYQDELNGRLQTQLGYTHLLQGNASAALQAFEQAQNDRAEGIHRLYFGHAALLDHDETTALIEYGNIITDETLGKALFDLENMANHLPEQRTRLLDFLRRIRSALLRNRSQMDSTAVDYYWAYLKIQPASAQQQWEVALNWSATATGLAEQVFNRLPNDRSWQNNWLDGLLNQSYYLLFTSVQHPDRLSQAIQISQEAERYFEQDGQQAYYPSRALILTNLAHAYWLRQQADDRQQAIQIYQAFLTNTTENYDPWEVLLKDFRDLRQGGVQWPDLAGLIRAIMPEGATLSAADKEALGL